MASYKITWNRSAARELEKLPRDAISRIVNAVNNLPMILTLEVREGLLEPTRRTICAKVRIGLFTRLWAKL